MRQPSLYLFSLFFLLFAERSVAQAFDNDARAWLNLSLSTKPARKLETEFVLQNRLSNNVTQYTGYLTLNASYKIIKGLRVTGGASIGLREELEAYYSKRWQLYGGLLYRYSLQNLKVSFRTMVQLQQAGFSEMYDGSQRQAISRNKLTAAYQFSKQLGLQLSSEFYYTLGDSRTYSGLRRTRYQIAGSYKFSKTFEVEPFFILQRNFKLQGAPERAFIYGLNLKKSI